MNLEALRTFIGPLARRVANMIDRGVVQAVDDAKQAQLLQVKCSTGDVRDEVEHALPYGLTSRPPVNSEVVIAFIGGRREHGIALATFDRRVRLVNLASGEVAVYNDAGAKIVLKANGDVEVTPKPGQKLKVTGTVEVTGNLSATGTITGTTDVVAGSRSLSSHTHAAGALVAPPGGGPVTGATGP